MKLSVITSAAMVTAIIAVVVAPRAARAEEPSATAASPETPGAQSTPIDKGPKLLFDAKLMFLVRSDDGYFQHTATFRYDMPRLAAGFGLGAGVEIVPRLALLANAHYELSGADRDDAHLRIQSGAIVGVVRYAFYRLPDSEGRPILDLAGTAGFGRYLIRETYVNTALSPQTFEKSDGSFGGQLGAELAIMVSSFRASAGYAYSYSPAFIGDRIDGKAYAGGHEIALGVGVRL